ncbi:MAG: protein translocase subunit SecD [bacterium]|nr:protein translocase subunit SecD [bacterium]
MTRSDILEAGVDKKVLIRIALILAIVGIAGFSLYPPGEKINYGLDLRGGIHLVLQVETEDAVKAELDDSAQRLKSAAADESLILGEITVDKDRRRFQIGVPESVDRSELGDVASTYLPDFNVTRGADSWTFTFEPNAEKYHIDRAVRQAQQTITNRIDQFGVAEPVIQRQGLDSNRILVQLPGVDDPERVKNLIGNTAFLELKEVVAGPVADRQTLLSSVGGLVPHDEEVVTGDQTSEIDSQVIGTFYYRVKKASIITGRELRTARRSQDEYGQPIVNFSLLPGSVNKFADYTESHIGTAMAIVLDGKVMSAPVIRSRIPGDGMIEGNFSIDEAEDLALVLRAGALPAKITYLEERTVGPSLGRDSVVRGVRAAVSGLVLVMIFMLIYYRKSGLNANVALVLNIIILMGAMAYFSATLTLPGIAGVILTIGMAVDANVLIFERIREELRVGKTVRSAIDTGFSRAFGTILDANLTTLVAALFLFQFGTGPVKGFAVTLSIGILASMFTAVFVSRTLYMLALAGRDRMQTLSI